MSASCVLVAPRRVPRTGGTANVTIWVPQCCCRYEVFSFGVSLFFYDAIRLIVGLSILAMARLLRDCKHSWITI